jgi:hypothetical protein
MWWLDVTVTEGSGTSSIINKSPTLTWSVQRCSLGLLRGLGAPPDSLALWWGWGPVCTQKPQPLQGVRLAQRLILLATLATRILCFPHPGPLCPGGRHSEPQHLLPSSALNAAPSRQHPESWMSSLFPRRSLLIWNLLEVLGVIILSQRHTEPISAEVSRDGVGGSQSGGGSTSCRFRLGNLAWKGMYTGGPTPSLSFRAFTGLRPSSSELLWKEEEEEPVLPGHLPHAATVS